MLENTHELLSQNLAVNIIALRKKRKMTQSALAKVSGLPRSTLASMECGMGNPSLQNLSKVCEALHISFEELLATPRSSVKLIRKAEIPTNKRAKGNVLVYKLLPDAIPGMAIDRIELEPGARMGGIPHSTGTKEYLHCVEGQMTVAVNGENFELQTGDVLAFPGESAHSYLNHGNKKAVGISVVTLSSL
jgi:quercetin dioxygenase-like cupin family protein/DNA-binding XRE family transcriptional regulator